MATLNYATEYSQALSEAYPYSCYFGALWSATKPEVQFLNSNTVKLPKITTTGRVNGDRSSIGSTARNFNNDWETKTVNNHRTWGTLIHPRDINETNHVVTIQNVTKVFNETQKFPELDAIALGTLYKLKNAIAAITAKDKGYITKETVLIAFDTLMTAMDEARLPEEGRICYCDFPTKTLLKNAIAISRNSGDANVVRIVSRLDNVEIIGVPSNMMKTAFTLNDGTTKTGFEATSSALNVKMFLVHPSAVIPAIHYEFAKLDEPSAMSEGKWVYFEESFEDMFIYDQKHEGLQFLVEKTA